MKSASGSVLVYVLIAVVLFAALSYALVRTLSHGGVATKMDSDQARLQGEELINYATAARATIEQMRGLTSVLPEDFNFVKQGGAGYATEPHTAKVYHPAGGGLSIFTPGDPLFADNTAKRGWVVQQGTNVGWTASAGSDIILTFLDLDPQICAAINDRLYKDAAVPVTTVDSSETFINGGADDADFTSSDCATCNGRISFCIQDAAGKDAFYTIILGR